jgi:hypothetical protein
MLKTLTLALLLVGCTDTPAPVELAYGDAGWEPPCDTSLEGTACAAAFQLSWAVCSRNQECYSNGDTENLKSLENCMWNTLDLFCESRDCDVLYTEWETLNGCINKYVEVACDTPGYVPSCKL